METPSYVLTVVVVTANHILIIPRCCLQGWRAAAAQLTGGLIRRCKKPILGPGGYSFRNRADQVSPDGARGTLTFSARNRLSLIERYST